MSENRDILYGEEPGNLRIGYALDIAFRYGQTDGDHHRLWVIDQMVRMLTTDEEFPRDTTSNLPS